MRPRPWMLAALLAAPPALAAPPLDEVLQGLAQVREPGDLALSPDGRLVAFVERPGAAGPASPLFLAATGGGEARRVTTAAGTWRELAPTFSPDGRRLAFLSDAGSPGQAQVFVAELSRDGRAGAPRRLTTGLKGDLTALRFAPDGASLALLYVPGATGATGPLEAHARDAGVVVERETPQRLALVDAKSGAVRDLSPPALHVYDFDWAPDAGWLALEAVFGSGTNDYWIAGLYRLEAASGDLTELWKPSLQLAAPRVSPDGRGVAVIQGLMSDEGSNGGEVWLVPAGGGPARNLTPGLPASARGLHWRSPGELWLLESRAGGMALESLEPSTGARRELWAGLESLSSFVVAPSGQTAAVRHSFDRPPEVQAGAPGDWRPVTAWNAAVQRFWGPARSLEWETPAGRAQGFLLPPVAVEPGRRYPLVVVVHGGPGGAHQAGWPSRWTGLLPSQGFYTLLPNPRGSFGFGDAFARANVRDFGWGDLDDVLAGVDAALAAAPIDPQRLGIAGWSYGGYMAMWAPTRTTRFKAAVAGAGIANWQSYYGQNRIARWLVPFFGATVYDDPWIYARSSPITFVQKHRTPTLILHGERDAEVPAPQGYELWRALRTLGVPSELVVYPDEGHHFRQGAHQLDLARRSVEWLQRWLGAGDGQGKGCSVDSEG